MLWHLFILLVNSVDLLLCEKWQEDYEHLCHDEAMADWKVKSLGSAAQGQDKLELLTAMWEYEKYQRKMKENMSDYVGIAENPDALSSNEGKKYDKIENNLDEIFFEFGFCDGDICNIPLQPDLENLMKETKDAKKRLNIWNEFRKKAGPKLLDTFHSTTKLLNAIAPLNGFKNIVDQWEGQYDGKLWKETERLWNEIKPLYEIIHAWVRLKLKQAHHKLPHRTIPAHLLGDIWGKDWSSLLNKRFVTNITGHELLNISVEFMKSLGFSDLGREFISQSIVRLKEDRCVGEVQGFCTGQNIKAIICPASKWLDVANIMHQVAEAYRLTLTKHLEFRFREIKKTDLPDLHIGLIHLFDVIASSGLNWKRFGEQKTVDGIIDTSEDLAFLAEIALQTFGSLSYNVALGSWRMKMLLNGKDYNNVWWESRQTYQGIEPPESTEIKEHFDAGHPDAFIVQDNLRQFLGSVLKYQIFGALCKKETPEKLLYKCDLTSNSTSGKTIINGLKLGSSKKFSDVLKILTGSRKRESAAMLEYFEPLRKHLLQELREANEPVGWQSEGSVTVTSAAVVGSVVFVVVVLMILWFLLHRRRHNSWRISK